MQYFLISLALLAGFICSGQDSTKKQIKYTRTRIEKRVYKEYTVIKDSTGKQLAYSEWKPKFDSGDFTLTKKEITDTTYILKWLSPEDKKKQFENAPPPRLSPFFKNGEKMHSFAAKDISGNKISLDQFQGRIVVINFFITADCASCRREMTEVNRVVNEYGRDHPVVFLALSRHTKPEIEEFLKTTGIKSGLIPDAKKIADSYGINKFPVYVVIDGEGIVRFHTYGTAPKNVDFIKQTINAIIKEKGASF